MGHFIESGGRSYTLETGKQVLGCGADADLVFAACAGLAPLHAEVRPLLGGFVIKHLAGSAYTTLVNGDVLETCKTLSVGDVLQLGELELSFALDLKQNELRMPVVELPPLPANLAGPKIAATAPMELPPLPANLQAPPSMSEPDAGGIPPLGALLAPVPAPTPAASLPIADSASLSPQIQLAPSARKKTSPIKDNLLAITATLLIIGTGVTMLMKRANQLSHAGGVSPAPDVAARTDDPPASPVANNTPKAAVHWASPHEDLKLNFRFYPPAQEWKPNKDGVYGSALKIQLASDIGRCRFLLFGEAVGDGAAEDDLVGQAKHRMVVATQTMNFKEQLAETIAGLPFQRFDAAGMMGTSHYFVNLTLHHKGFFYHLVTFGEIPEEAFIKASAVAMAERFELIDPQRQLTLQPQHDVRGFRDAYHGYAMDLDRLAWALWRDRELEFPAAQFSVMSHNGLPFGIVPVRFHGDPPDIDSFSAAVLAGLDLAYPSPGLEVHALEQAGMKGRSIVAKRSVDGVAKSYYLRVLLGRQAGYLLGGWGEGMGDYHTRTLLEAMQAVEFFEPEAAQLSSTLTYGQRKGQSRIRYQLGLQALRSGDAQQALEVFQEVVGQDSAFVEIAIPLVEAFVANGRLSDGLAFMQRWAASNDDPSLSAALALMQCSAGDWEAGGRRLASLFASGHVNALALRRYWARLRARSESSDSLASSMDPIRLAGRERLAQAALDNRSGRYEEALEILNPLRKAHPQEPLLWLETITASVGLGQPDSALALAKSVSPPSLAAYLQAHRYLCLEKPEEAKNELRTAVWLAPNEPLYVAELLAVHALEAPAEADSTSPSMVAQPSHESPNGTTIERRLKVGQDGDLDVEEVARFASASAAKYWQLFEALNDSERLERLALMLPLAHNIDLSEAKFEHLGADDAAPATLLLRYTVRGAFQREGNVMRGPLEWPLETMVLGDPSMLGGAELLGKVSVDLPDGWKLTEAWPDSEDPVHTWKTTANAGRININYRLVFSNDTPTPNALLANLRSDMVVEQMAVTVAVDGEQE